MRKYAVRQQMQVICRQAADAGNMQSGQQMQVICSQAAGAGNMQSGSRCR
jgi:hypothetical protein